MATGWPRNQQDLRWPDSEDADTSPGGRSDRGQGDRGQGDRGRAGRDAGFLDGEFGADHPSGPLPVSPAVQPRERGRLGRGKSRGGRGPASGDVADADYDWIRYIGEAGPAQEAQKPPSTAREDAELAAGSRGNTGTDSGHAADPGRSGGRLLPRRDAAPAQPDAWTDPAIAGGPSGPVQPAEDVNAGQSVRDGRPARFGAPIGSSRRLHLGRCQSRAPGAAASRFAAA